MDVTHCLWGRISWSLQTAQCPITRKRRPVGCKSPGLGNAGTTKIPAVHRQTPSPGRTAAWLPQGAALSAHPYQQSRETTVFKGRLWDSLHSVCSWEILLHAPHGRLMPCCSGAGSWNSYWGSAPPANFAHLAARTALRTIGSGSIQQFLIHTTKPCLAQHIQIPSFHNVFLWNGLTHTAQLLGAQHINNRGTEATYRTRSADLEALSLSGLQCRLALSQWG